MRLRTIRIENFRCIHMLTLELDEVTVLVGANSTGKSSAIHAIGWFFGGGALDPADIAGLDESATVTVGATFTDFTDADRTALGRYVVSDEATFSRRWSTSEGEKLTGHGLAYPPFEDVRRHDRAGERITAYRALRDTRPDLSLPTARSAQAADDAMRDWEAEHPDLLEMSTISATHLFGFAGQARLAGRYDFVLVPAMSDPEAEARDARGTLLRQLLDRTIGEQANMRERLRELEADVSERMHAIVEEEGSDALQSLSERVTRELAQLIPGASVTLAARPPAFQVPPIGVDLQVADRGVETDVARQGHGFQRALLIALVQQLAALNSISGEDAAGDPAGLFLALEEPELYQHPLQARHFAATLADLASEGSGTIQIAYATHSEYFVDPTRYQWLRRFRKQPTTKTWPSAHVTQASVERVAQRLDGIVPAAQAELRIRITLRRALAEAVFAKGVLIVEGHSDAGLLHGLADRRGGFDAAGIAIVNGQGKRQLLLPWAILTELGVPTYVVFDADARVGERLQAQQKSAEQVAAAEQAAIRENKLVLEALSASARDWPSTTVAAQYAVFEDTLESELATWGGFTARVDELLTELGDFRTKSEDAYRQAAQEMPSDPPEIFGRLLDAVLEIAR